MKLRCVKTMFEETSGLITKKITKHQIPNLTVGKIYEVIYIPHGYLSSERIKFFNDQKEWETIRYDEVGGSILLSFFEPVE